ncbi:MAG: hypothetical protein EOL87_02375 [Spartobacteria bacterium]|nr:hypothetical protein [Spartobacteria bacterium]
MNKCKYLFLSAGLLAGSSFAMEWPTDIHGFAETRFGVRTQPAVEEDAQTMEEVRLQLEAAHDWEYVFGNFRGDFLYDNKAASQSINLDDGSGFFDLREANLTLAYFETMDVKVGRQILTWGTGDMLFINDLFPKDWPSFFLGRDDEYLKAPSDAALVSYFPEWFSLYVAYTPCFDPDRAITGERLSYYNPRLGTVVGQDYVMETDRPNRWFRDDEWALRLNKMLGGYDVSLYAYRGFWKTPSGMDLTTGHATYTRLNSYGASVQGSLGTGIGSLETGYYDSADDTSGDNPSISNSQARFLVGYSRELIPDLSLGSQYYLEWTQDYDAYKTALPAGMIPADEFRHVLTLRLTYMLMNQDLMLSFFGYWSPSDQDAYLRPSLSYKMTDDLLLTGGGNIFVGDHDYTFFGQFEDNSNIYAGIRYSF